MYRFIRVIGFISMVLLAANRAAYTSDRASLAAILPALDTYISQSIEAEGIPGAVIVVVKDGKIIHLKGYGVKVAGQSNPVDSKTPFALASITKNFTITLIGRLVDQGRLRWDDKVLKYLPDFRLSDPGILQELTIEDLLSHRSGLPGFSGDSFIELGWKDCEIYDAMKNIPTEGEFRKTYNYQNIMVGLTGLIIEKVTGKRLTELYREELFTPLGLTDTYIKEKSRPGLWQRFLNLFQKSPAKPFLHDRYNGQTRYKPEGNPALYTFPASSGITTTGEDLGRWLIFQLNKGKVDEKPWVSEANIEEMRKPRVDVPIKGGTQFPKNRVTKVEYAMGWFAHDYAGAPVLSLMAGMAGVRALIMLVPQDNLGIGILINFGGMRVSLLAEAVRNKFLDLYLNVPDEQDWAKILRDNMTGWLAKRQKKQQSEMLRNPLPARSRVDYAGTFDNAVYGKVTIEEQGNHLRLVYRNCPPVTLAHVNGDIFQFNASDLSPSFSGTDVGEVLFSQDQGKASSLMVSIFHEGQDTLFKRAEESR